ncbi:MAG: RES family NAD+ phosphorylase [Pseudomonadota bacterium]
MIRSIHPPIDLFEDIADPADWEAIASAEAKTNPRANIATGDLAKVPIHRRVSGPGSSWVMAPFIHCSTRRPGRFSDGRYGVYYAGDSEDVAVHETAHHHARFMRQTNQEPGWTSQFRVLIGRIDATLHDAADESAALNPDDYAASQTIGARLRAEGSEGIVYPSVRMEGGKCIAIFWPDVVSIPVQGAHWAYHFDGERVDAVKRLDDGAVFAVSD